MKQSSEDIFVPVWEPYIQFRPIVEPEKISEKLVF